jgi:hypothetical protein
MEANQETVRITMDRVFEESGLGISSYPSIVLPFARNPNCSLICSTKVSVPFERLVDPLLVMFSERIGVTRTEQDHQLCRIDKAVAFGD